MHNIVVVVPAFNVGQFIVKVVQETLPHVSKIIVVDDRCPQNSGKIVESHGFGERVQVIYNATNLGVGGATLAGFTKAFREGASIVVKLDGDGQMDSSLIPLLIEPIQLGLADYVKGNRFYNPEDLAQMPFVRLVGNAALSFMSKISTGYWRIFDPTNGFIAIHKVAFAELRTHKIANRYFFETDLLFRLNIIRAVVKDVPMPAKYGTEQSGLKIIQELPRFFAGHFRVAFKRIFYNYLLRDFNMASVELFCGLPILLFGVIFGAYHWWLNSQAGMSASSGTVMLAALPTIIGFQLILGFLNYDSSMFPKTPLQLKGSLRLRSSPADVIV